MEPYSVTLKRVREEKGLTTSQVAEKTHMLVQVVEDLECERFKRIPAPIYGRGFIRLYAGVLGLDPVPLAADFMAAYTGARPTAQDARRADAPFPQDDAARSGETPLPQDSATKSGETPLPQDSATKSGETPLPQEGMPLPKGDDAQSGAAPLPQGAAAPVLDTIAPSEPSAVQPSSDIPPVTAPFDPPVVKNRPEPSPEVRGLDLFEQANRVARARTAAAQMGAAGSSPYVSTAANGRAGDKPAKKPSRPAVSAADRFRGGLSAVSHGVLGPARQIPPSVWRMALLGVGAAAAVGLIAWACGALYRLTEGGAPAAEIDPSRQAPVLAAAAEDGAPAASPRRPEPAPSAQVTSSGAVAVPQLYVD